MYPKIYEICSKVNRQWQAYPKICLCAHDNDIVFYLQAQGLNGVITSALKLQSSDHHLYILKDADVNKYSN